MVPQPTPSLVGLAVSKATLAVCYQLQEQLRHLQVSNTKAGFEQWLKACGSQGLFVREATGT